MSGPGAPPSRERYSAIPRSALHALQALGELALPLRCAGCERDGTRWCADCGRQLCEQTLPLGLQPVSPRPRPLGLPPVWSTRHYEGVVRTALVAAKDDGRRDLFAVLAPLLGQAIAAVVERDDALRTPLERDNGPVLVVPVPSSAASIRRRGDASLQTLLGRALPFADVPPDALLPAPALRLRRRVADQAGLGSRERAANLEHAFEVRRRWSATVAGATVLVVDDVLTTGATLAEAARALRRGGARHVSAVTIAATARR